MFDAANVFTKLSGDIQDLLNQVRLEAFLEGRAYGYSERSNCDVVSGGQVLPELSAAQLQEVVARVPLGLTTMDLMTDFDLGHGSFTFLDRNHLSTIETVVNLTEGELMNLPYATESRVREVKKVLKALGYTLRVS